MRKIKKLISIVFVFLILINNNCIFCYAQVDDDFYAQYSGSTDASWGYKPNCTFTIYEIENNEFRGRFSASNLGSYSFDEQVKGKVYSSRNSITCVFTVNFYNDRYYSNITATINKLEGTCECYCSGSWHLEDFVMTGTKFNYPTGFGVDPSFLSYSEEDMKMCMELSNAIYGDKNAKSKNVKYIAAIKRIFSDTCMAYGLKNDEELMFYNIIDSNKYNAFFTITNRTNHDNSIDIIVTVRGTLKDEWQGNTEITGDYYDQNKTIHDNFNTAKESIKTAIEIYYSNIAERSETINLIITGHSRGAAISNLYAKEATDAQNTTEDHRIPRFSNVTAYTFACPNVEKYNSQMESYTNIFNFCFREDLVATVPLTEPIYGWNYWKYGQTYVGDLSDYNHQVSKNAVSKIHNAFSGWRSVEAYYNSYITLLPSSTTLYQLAHDATGTFMSYSLTFRRCMDSFKLIGDLAVYDNRTKILLYEAILNSKSIGLSHNYETYNGIINGTITSPGDNIFYHCSYDSMLEEAATSTYSLQSNNDVLDTCSSYILDSSSVLQLRDFANYENNLSLLGWNIDEPSTWQGVTWNEDGDVESIIIPFKNLTGTLDLSNFSSLIRLDVTGNNLTSINLTNCLSLEELDCSFNQLTTLDVSDCTNLLSLTCCYNYLDTHEGGALYNTLDDLMFDDCYVNYYPQAVPDNATFNTTELNVLKTFANTAENNSELDWFDDNGNIDTQKLQNNVLFEYDGSEYRVIAINVSDTNVEGTLNLASFTQLKELYCENTKIYSLNLNGCTKLDTLHCDGSDLTTLILPSNSSQKTSSLYDVSCEYNYLNTNIFTQDIIRYVEFKAGGKIEYLNQKGEDPSALQAAVDFANTLNKGDYSIASFEELSDLLDYCDYFDFENLWLTQSDIDELTSEILTAIYDLKAYFKVNISVDNGTLSMTYDDNTYSESANYRILHGTNISLDVTPNEGFSFIGWYDMVNNRYMSRNSHYEFKTDSNIKLKAMIIPTGSATLTFSNYSNWIAGTVSKTTTEWAEITSIDDLLPEVPYRYGHSNGRWVYSNSEVLAQLQLGQDVTVVAQYDDDATSLPIPREAVDKPVLDLYYNYDTDNVIGSFVMAAGFPEDIQVESVGVAFYYDKPERFIPTNNFTLLLNNKMVVSRFNIDELEDIYIVNVKNLTSTYNWAARGYVSYYNDSGGLVTAYSNQINIIGTEEIIGMSFSGLITDRPDIDDAIVDSKIEQFEVWE